MWPTWVTEWPCPDLTWGQILILTFQGQIIQYTWFDAPWRDKHDGIKIVALPLKVHILSSKNRLDFFLEFWPLVTSILTWAKKWPKWFRNDFSRAFERRFPFCSTMRRSRDRRGVFKHPPSGGGKSRGPPGRGLIKKERNHFTRVSLTSCILCSAFFAAFSAFFAALFAAFLESPSSSSLKPT